VTRRLVMAINIALFLNPTSHTDSATILIFITSDLFALWSNLPTRHTLRTTQLIHIIPTLCVYPSCIRALGVVVFGFSFGVRLAGLS